MGGEGEGTTRIVCAAVAKSEMIWVHQKRGNEKKSSKKRREWSDERNKSHLSPLPAHLPSPSSEGSGLGWRRGNKIWQKLRLPVATGSSRRVVMETGVQEVLNVLGEQDFGGRGWGAWCLLKGQTREQEGGAGRHDSIRRVSWRVMGRW